MNKKMIHMVTFILLIIGGLNWLVVGIFGQDLVMEIFGTGTLAKVIYILVGLSALYELMTHKSSCTMCKASGTTM
jgi:uncharacterized membrane protein YuzA (DUF378 family)